MRSRLIWHERHPTAVDITVVAVRAWPPLPALHGQFCIVAFEKLHLPQKPAVPHLRHGSHQ